MNARPIVLGSAVIALLAIIPAVHAQSIRKPSPVLRDGNLGPNQIVDDRSKKPFAAPNTKLRPLAFRIWMSALDHKDVLQDSRRGDQRKVSGDAILRITYQCRDGCRRKSAAYCRS
jgi:hypothetical protein